MDEQVILELPPKNKLSDGGTTYSGPEVMVTTTRITVNGNTHSLNGVDRVSLDQVFIHPFPHSKRDAWVMVVVGVSLVFIYPPVGLAIAGAGIWSVWDSRDMAYFNFHQYAQVYLHQGTKSSIAYSDRVREEAYVNGVWVRENPAQATKLARSIADALGVALSHRSRL